MNKKYALLFYLLSTFFFILKGKNEQQAISSMERLDKRYFIENKGQWPRDVLYLCRMGGLDFWITRYGMNFTFYKIEKDKGTESLEMKMGKHHVGMDNATVLGHRVLLEFEGGNLNCKAEGRQKQEGYYNYLIGNDPGKHASFVGLYKEVVVKDVYEGIDVRYYFEAGKGLRYDFVVHPHADISKIKMRLKGQEDAYVKGGNWIFKTRFGEVKMMELKTYQENKSIRSCFKREGEIWGH
jgi:hypothetical protein